MYNVSSLIGLKLICCRPVYHGVASTEDKKYVFDVPLCWTAARSRVGDTFDRTCPSIIIRAQYSRMGIIMKSASTKKVCVVSLPFHHHARWCSKHVREHQQGITPCSKKKQGITSTPIQKRIRVRCSSMLYGVHAVRSRVDDTLA